MNRPPRIICTSPDVCRHCKRAVREHLLQLNAYVLAFSGQILLTNEHKPERRSERSQYGRLDAFELVGADGSRTAPTKQFVKAGWMAERVPQYITATCPYCGSALVEAHDNLDHTRAEHGWVAYAPHVHGPLLVRFRCEHGHTGELRGAFEEGEMRWHLPNDHVQ